MKGYIADALLDLGKVVKCPLCHEIFLHGRNQYDFLTRIPHSSPENRKLLRYGRKHCREKHDDRWVWNFVSDERLTESWLDKEEKVHALILLALARGAKLFPLPPQTSCGAYTCQALMNVFYSRLSAACAWLQWSFPRRTKLRETFWDCKSDADKRLRLLMADQTPLLRALEVESIEGRVNLLQLLSCDRRLYRRLNLF